MFSSWDINNISINKCAEELDIGLKCLTITIQWINPHVLRMYLDDHVHTLHSSSNSNCSSYFVL